MNEIETLYSLIKQTTIVFGPILGILIIIILIIIYAVISFFFKRIKNIADDISKKAIIQFELQLNQDLEKYKIDYTSLIKERATVIQKIYHLLVCIEDTQIDNKFGEDGNPYHGNYTNRDGSSVIDGRKDGVIKIIELLEISNSFYSLYNKNKIYFSPNICAIFDKLITNLHIFWESIGQKHIYIEELKKLSKPLNIEEYKELNNKMGIDINKDLLFYNAQVNIKKLKIIIEDEFRKLLSIE